MQGSALCFGSKMSAALWALIATASLISHTQLRGQDSRSPIFDDNLHLTASRGRPHANPASIPAVLKGVADKVAKTLRENRGIAQYRGQQF